MCIRDRVISGPQPEGAQGPVLNLALVVPPASLHFGGALVASLDASFFSTVLDSVRYADDMQAEVVHAGGTVLAASPPSAGVRSRAQPDSPFMQHRASGQQESVRLGQVPGQAGVRLVAQRNFRPTTAPMDGLVLSVSRALNDVHEPWQRQVAIAAMAFLALLGGSWQAMRLLQRRRREMIALASERAAQQAAHAEQLALALRGADLALWDAELPGGRMSVNERWFTMIGLQPGEVTPDNEAWPVSYTHLDVYKRQEQAARTGRPVYEARAGWRDATASVNLRHDLGPHWALLALSLIHI